MRVCGSWVSASGFVERGLLEAERYAEIKTIQAMNHTPFTQPHAQPATRRRIFPAFKFQVSGFGFLLSAFLCLLVTPSANAGDISLYTLTYGAGTGGRISTDYPQGAYDPGTLMTFTAVPNSGYLFLIWQIQGSQLIGRATSAETGFQITNNTTLAAYFILNAPVALPATHWLGQTGSNWSDANWASDTAGTPTNATPTSNSTVTFSATGAGNQSATVLAANTTIGGLIVSDSNPVGIAGGKTLTISNALDIRDSANLTISGNGTVVSAGKDITVANNSGDNATLNISGGAEITGINAYVAAILNSVGTLNVDGPGSKLTLTGALTVDGGGNGTLNITNGGVVSNADGHLARGGAIFIL